MLERGLNRKMDDVAQLMSCSRGSTWVVFNYIHVKGSFFQNDIYLYMSVYIQGKNYWSEQIPLAIDTQACFSLCAVWMERYRII